MIRIRLFAFLIVLILMSQSIAINDSTVYLDEIHSEITENSIQYTDNHTIIEIGPSSRKAILEMPGGHNVSHKLPLVVALHGYTNSGSFVSSYLDLIESVHENGHLLLRPDGTFSATGQRYWNATDACCNIWNEEVDDVGWLTVLINEAITYYGADSEGVILVGHSNGGFMAHRMACERGNMIRAAISLAGATYYDFSDCQNTGTPNILQIHGELDSVIQYDGGSILGDSYPSAPQTVNYWANRSGCDSSPTAVNQLDLISPNGYNDTIEFEHLNCTAGNRVSLWGIPDGGHLPSVSSASDDDFAETILDWGLNGYFPDSDGDGVRDDTDDFPNDPNETLDSDGDGVGDNSDMFPDDPNETLDSDGDGVGDNSDIFPNDPNEILDTDGDGVGDNSDIFPNDPNETLDSDYDGVGDNFDMFPNDPNETLDTDRDGVGDNSDIFPLNPMDSIDTDGDGVGDNSDEFPYDPYETLDSDGDGVGDNSDIFPNDPNETLDSDADGTGDNADMFPNNYNETLDYDGDGVGDNADMFPNDLNETIDTDGDGVGDNADMFPYDSSETIDFDGDGVGDNSDIFPEDLSEDTDTDGDGVGDNSDAFPDDSSEYTDTDGDGVGDNSDFYPGDPERWLYLDSQISQKEIMISILIISSIVYLFRSPKSSSEDEYSDTDFEE